MSQTSDTERVLSYYNIRGEYAEYLKRYFWGVWIEGDGYCYYDAVYQGVLEGLSLREREELRVNDIINKKTFYEAITTFFEEKIYDGNKVKIRYNRQRRKQGRVVKETEITLSQQEIRSLRAKTLSCANSKTYGSSHSNELIKAFFYEKFSIDVEINELFFVNTQSHTGWRWTKKNGTMLKVYPTKIKHVFILTKQSTKHYSLLVPKRAPNDRPTLVQLRYSFDNKKITATVAGGEVINLENYTVPRKRRIVDMIDISSSSSESSSSESSSSESSSSESSSSESSSSEREAKRAKATHTIFVYSDEESDDGEAKKQLYNLKF